MKSYMYNWRACNISENPSLKTKTTWLTKKLINAHGMPCVKVSLKQSIVVYIILLWLWISMLIRILSMLIFVSALLKCIDAACLSSINNKFRLNIFKFGFNFRSGLWFTLCQNIFFDIFHCYLLFELTHKYFFSESFLKCRLLASGHFHASTKRMSYVDWILWIINSVWGNRKV